MRDPDALSLRFAAVRKLERALSVQGFYQTLQPLAFARAVAALFERRRVKPPGCFDPSRQVPRTKQRRNDYLNDILEFIPDRLGTAKWIERCQFSGLDRLQQARRSGRPVVVAFCHSGPYKLLRFWLRATGLSAATLIKGASKRRKRLPRMQDQLSPFPEIPTALYQDQLREAIELLTSGHPLLIALDGQQGAQMKVPMRGPWSFQMSTGPIRLAVRHRAELFPCFIVDEGGWRFRLELGRPVPREFLSTNTGWSHAAKHLVDELFPHFEARPDQCSSAFLRCFRPELPGPIESHPTRSVPVQAG
jgi:hypothetical protein